MDNEKIEKLLEAFYEGSTTADEERQLADYFRSEKNVPEKWKADAAIILSLDGKKHEDVEIPEGLEQRLSDAIDAKAATESEGKVVHVAWLKVISIAASIAIIAGIGIALLNGGKTDNVAVKPKQQVTAQTVKPKPQVVQQSATEQQPKRLIAKAAKPVRHRHYYRAKMKVQQEEVPEVKETEQPAANDLADVQLTDEQCKIAFEALELMAQKLKAANEEYSLADAKVQEVKETIDKELSRK
jgi:hypothetical protein